MPNTFFQFKSFTIHQEQCAMKVTTDASLFGAWIAHQVSDATRLLDVGAGTGLLSLMVAQACKGEIDALEIEASCFKQLSENISASQWSDRIHPQHQDFKTFETEQHYDCIFSNPPFHQDQLATGNKATDLARHEAGLTLESLISKCSSISTSNGKLFLLIPFYRTAEVIAIAKKQGWHEFTRSCVSQSPKHGYFRTMIGFQLHESKAIQESALSIKVEDDAYSPEFMQLLQSYYLAF